MDVQSVLARRLWKPGTNTCINGNTAGVIVQSGGKRILRVTGVLGLGLRLPSPRSALAAASSALRSLLCTMKENPAKEIARSAQSVLVPLIWNCVDEGSWADGGDYSNVTYWSHSSEPVYFHWKIKKILYFYLSTEHSKRKGSPDVILSLRYLLTGFRLATY